MKRRTYTEQELKDAVASSSSIRQVLEALGLNPQGGGGYISMHRAFKDFCIDTSHFNGKGTKRGNGSRFPTFDYLSNKRPISSYKLKQRLLKDNLLQLVCSSCGLTQWLGGPIPLELDHINGNHADNTQSNLRLLCPNCHSLTPTHAGKNRGKASYSLT